MYIGLKDYAVNGTRQQKKGGCYPSQRGRSKMAKKRQKKASRKKPIAQLKSKRAIFRRLKNPKGWKMPTKRVTVSSQAAARRIQEALVHYTGGAETVMVTDFRKKKLKKKYRVGSKGYYHYIGA